MHNIIRRAVRIALLPLLISAVFPAAGVRAQSGSAGGSIGNDDKSVSGSRQAPRSVEPERPARRTKPEATEPRRAARKSGGEGGGGGGNFDGTWVANAVGNTCSSSDKFVITGGRMLGQYSSGQVNPNGSATSGGSISGLSWHSTGRFSGRSGSGTFVRTDGCTGTWTASKL